MIKRTIAERVLLSLSLLAALTISPFALMRWFNGETALAIIDGAISLTAILFFMFVFFTRKVDTAKKSFALLLALTALATIYIQSETQILWIFPTIISIYYLMPLKLARATNIVLVFAILIVIYSKVDLTSFLTILATTTLTTSLAFVIFRSYNEKQSELSLLASVDSLTNSGNRRALDLNLSEVIASQQRGAYTMCLMLIDLDNFKDVNDNHGHAIGDQILISVSDLIKKHIRVLDSLYRYGGDEFIVMPLNMNINTTKSLAEKIRSIIEQYKFINDIKITLSIGVAEYKSHDTPESWISRADTALYEAKEGGRNKIC